jgi:hypothetical protein
MSKGGMRGPVKRPTTGNVDALRHAVLQRTPIIKGENKKGYGARLKAAFEGAMTRMARREHRQKHGTSKYKPHQGAKECARRVRQMSYGQIYNYGDRPQYPSYH